MKIVEIDIINTSRNIICLWLFYFFQNHSIGPPGDYDVTDGARITASIRTAISQRCSEILKSRSNTNFRTSLKAPLSNPYDVINNRNSICFTKIKIDFCN